MQKILSDLKTRVESNGTERVWMSSDVHFLERSMGELGRTISSDVSSTLSNSIVAYTWRFWSEISVKPSLYSSVLFGTAAFSPEEKFVWPLGLYSRL